MEATRTVRGAGYEPSVYVTEGPRGYRQVDRRICPIESPRRSDDQTAKSSSSQLTRWSTANAEAHVEVADFQKR